MSSSQLDQALAGEMVREAVAFCAEKAFAGDSQQARQALQQGRCDVCGYVSSSLVRQVGEYLGQMDKTVKAVYQFEPEPTSARPQVVPSNQDWGTKGIKSSGIRTGINLVAWVDRKSAALNALGETVEAVLAESRRGLGCKNATPACYTLEVEMVDDKDVLERRGYGVVVNSMYMRSVPVWTRAEAFELVAGKAGERGLLAPFDAELAPEEILFQQARLIAQMEAGERAEHESRLRELKVILIRRIISDQLAYINIAKEWLTIDDLEEIHRRKIGYGRVGGKAAGMILAARILAEAADESVRACIRIPESYFLGSDVIYIFMAMNGLMHWNSQKYKPEEQIRSEYPQIQEEFQAGQFPPEVLHQLATVLEQFGPKPVIVRSSGQLEDNFGTAFAGKYESHFCPNQGAPQENLRALTNAIARTYASTLRPDALLYRRSKGLQDYDERMAVIIQEVQGEQWGRYYFPFGAGVAFSHNLYRWAPQIRREDGFARLVWGLGTRAVERVGDDYPRLVALSHPVLQPDDACAAIRRYSQQYVDVIDLEDNVLKTLPCREVLAPNYPPLRFLAQLEQDGYFTTPRSRVMAADIPKLALTFDAFLRRTPFAGLLSRMLGLLEEHCQSPVDIEFTVHVPDPQASPPEVKVSLLQCRPQSRLETTYRVHLPQDLPQEDIVFSSHFIVPQGHLPNIRYVIFVSPEKYFALPGAAARSEVGRVIARLNAALEKKAFICVGPGRWGATDIDLGVYVGYADICNAGALVEISGKEIGAGPEPSLGTHFFQDLMEAQIYPLAICLDHEETVFNRRFLYDAPNDLQKWAQAGDDMAACLRLIDVAAFRRGHHLELIMDDEEGQAVAFLAPDKE